MLHRILLFRFYENIPAVAMLWFPWVGLSLCLPSQTAAGAGERPASQTLAVRWSSNQSRRGSRWKSTAEGRRGRGRKERGQRMTPQTCPSTLTPRRWGRRGSQIAIPQSHLFAGLNPSQPLFLCLVLCWSLYLLCLRLMDEPITLCVRVCVCVSVFVCVCSLATFF